MEQIVTLLLNLSLVLCFLFLFRDPKISQNWFGIAFPFWINLTETSRKYPNDVTQVYKKQNFSVTEEKQLISWEPHITDNITNEDNLSAKVVQENAMNVRGTIYKLKNVFVNQGTTFSIGNVLYNPRHRFCKRWFEFNSSIFIGDVENAIIAGHGWVRYNYGHWFHDYLLPLMLFPDELVDNFYVINQGMLGVSFETLIAAGVRKSQILFLPPMTCMYARNLYIIDDPSPVLIHFGYCSRKLHEKFAKYFDLNRIEATDFCLTNRRYNSSRYIRNWNEVVDSVKTAFPEHKWKCVDDYIEDINTTARLWAAIRFIFLPSGSNCVKLYFMKRGSVLCVGEADVIDYSPMEDAASLGIFSQWFCFPGMTHFGNKKGWNVSTSLCVDNIRYALYCEKHQRWPSTETVS